MPNDEPTAQLFVGFHSDGTVETCGEQPHNPTDVAYVPLTEANDLREVVAILKQSRRDWKEKYRAAVAARDKEWRDQLGVPLGSDEGPVYCWEPSCVAEEARRLAVQAERERCEQAVNESVFKVMTLIPPDHYDDEGRLDGYSFAAISSVASRVVLAIRAEPKEEK